MQDRIAPVRPLLLIQLRLFDCTEWKHRRDAPEARIPPHSDSQIKAILMPDQRQTPHFRTVNGVPVRRYGACEGKGR